MHRPMFTLVMGPPAPPERYTVSPHTKINARFLGLFSIFLFCRFRLTRNVKGFLLGGRELSPNRPEKCQISSEMSANSQQMVPCRPDRKGRQKGIPQHPLARHSKETTLRRTTCICGVYGPRGRSPRRPTLNPNAPIGVSRGPPETQAGRGCGKSLVGLAGTSS